MSDEIKLTPIARIYSPYKDKFGVPRQSGLEDVSVEKIVFEPPFRDENCIREIESFSHLWLIWHFSESGSWSATVRPPKLGGNRRVGVFASRSPFRPNPLGLSCVRLIRAEAHTPLGPVLYVSGADLINETAIYDIKPYVPYCDIKPQAASGFALDPLGSRREVVFEPAALSSLLPEEQTALGEILSLDPRPGYQNDPKRQYTMDYGGMKVSFRFGEDKIIVTGVQK